MQLLLHILIDSLFSATLTLRKVLQKTPTSEEN